MKWSQEGGLPAAEESPPRTLRENDKSLCVLCVAGIVFESLRFNSTAFFLISAESGARV